MKGDNEFDRNWVSVLELYIRNTADLEGGRYPRRDVFLGITLDRSFSEIINGGTRPKSELLDGAIVNMTADWGEWYETYLGEGFGPFGMVVTGFNCSLCGGGLTIAKCVGCGNTFHDDPFRPAWETPLSRKMIAFLRDRGHKFVIDPEEALAKELYLWKVRNKVAEKG